MSKIRGATQRRPESEISGKKKSSSRHSDHGVKDEKAEDQPKDKRRARMAQKTGNVG